MMREMKLQYYLTDNLTFYIISILSKEGINPFSVNDKYTFETFHFHGLCALVLLYMIGKLFK